MERWPSQIDCQVGKLPIIYLGQPLGGKHNSLAFWNPIIDRVEKKLARWKSILLSLGGRITLLKFVLMSLPTFYMSQSQMPRGVKDRLERMQKRCLLGDMDDEKKVH